MQTQCRQAIFEIKLLSIPLLKDDLITHVSVQTYLSLLFACFFTETSLFQCLLLLCECLKITDCMSSL
jgi:hypothetical protein